MKKFNQLLFVLCFLALIFFVGYNSYKNVIDKTSTEDLSLKDRIADFEGAYKNNFYERQKIINIHGLSQRLLGNELVEDSEFGAIYKTKLGQLTILPSENDMSDFKDKIKTINTACDEKGIDALYIQAPFKILPSREAIDLPVGVTTAVNDNADSVLEMLDENNWKYYDLRPDFENCIEISPEKLFFNTDHHWTVDGAFYGFSRVMNYLYENYDYCKKDVLNQTTNKDNYTRYEMKNCFLGAWGRRVGVDYVDLDDFAYLVPKFQTDFHVSRIAPDVDNFEANGDFYTYIMSPKRVEKGDEHELSKEEKASYFGDGIYTDLYSVYMDGYTNEMIATNNTINSKKRVLIFHDSFGFPFSSFMCLTAKETRVIDLRIFEKDISEYIKEYNPDLVLMVYNPNQ